MSEQFYTILTKQGKAKIANATALGTKVNLTKFQVGDGNGTYYNPTEDQTGLKHKTWEGPISSITVDENNPNWIVLEVIIPHDVGGFMIREAGVFDDSGNLMAIGKYPETYKPVVADGSTKDLIIKMILEVSNTSSVTLKVDPTVILATQKDIQILNNKIGNIKVPVQSVNNKTGAIELKAEDIKTKDGTNLEKFKEDINSQYEDYTKRISNLSTENIEGLNGGVIIIGDKVNKNMHRNAIWIGEGVAQTIDASDTISIGNESKALWHYAIAIGEEATSKCQDGISIGRSSLTDGNFAIAIGHKATANNSDSIALGLLAETNHNYTIALGNRAVANNENVGVLGSTHDESPNKWIVPGSFTVNGTKNFEIPHPKPSKSATHRIRHGAVESPTPGDTLYRWNVKAKKENDIVKIDLPDYFIYLNKDVQIFVTPQGHFGNGYGLLNKEAEQLEIYCQNEGDYNVLVIGTRNDNHPSVRNWDIKGVERKVGESWTGETYTFEVDEIIEVNEITEEAI